MNYRSLSFAFLFALAFPLRLSLAADIEVRASTTSEQLVRYNKKMVAYMGDLPAIAKGLTGMDQEIAIMMANRAECIALQITHIEDLLAIDSLGGDEVVNQHVKTVVSDRTKFFVQNIDFTIKDLNIGLTYLKNPAVVAAVNKLKDDLRGLKELLLTL